MNPLKKALILKGSIATLHKKQQDYVKEALKSGHIPESYNQLSGSLFFSALSKTGLTICLHQEWKASKEGLLLQKAEFELEQLKPELDRIANIPILKKRFKTKYRHAADKFKFDNFQTPDNHTTRVKKTVEAWCDRICNGGWQDNPVQILILSGKPGNGKTHLLYSCIQECFISGLRSEVWQLNRFFQQLRKEEFSDGRVTRELMDRVCKAHVLGFDELGAQKWSEWELRTFCDILTLREQNGLFTIFSTNQTSIQNLVNKKRKTPEEQLHIERIHDRLKIGQWVHFNGIHSRRTI